MPWIESHQTVGHHPKTIRLAELLKVSLPAAVGHLHYFWWWALDFAPTGELRTTPAVLARACEWRGNAQRFRDALVQSGFLEVDGERLMIHDWMDYAGRYVDKRAANVERQRRWRNAHITRDERVSNGATVPNRTGPNQPDLPDPTPLPPSEPSEGGAPPNVAPDWRTEQSTNGACCLLGQLSNGEQHSTSCALAAVSS